jgi:hypothetical protein
MPTSQENFQIKEELNKAFDAFFTNKDWVQPLKEFVANEIKYGGMYMKIQPQIAPGKKHPLFYKGFEGCMSGAPNPQKQYQDITGLPSEPGPEWGAFIEGWEMCLILRDGTDRYGLPLSKQEVAIIFDLNKLTDVEVFGLQNWIGHPDEEQWEQASWDIKTYDGVKNGTNWWLVCRNKRWTGRLLTWLIQEKFPDASYRVVPDPNL